MPSSVVVRLLVHGGGAEIGHRTQATMSTRKPRLDRADRDLQGRGGLLITEARPVAERDDLLVLRAELVHDDEQTTHRLGVVYSLNHVCVESIRGFRPGQFGQKAVISATGSLGISKTVVGYRKEPREDRLAMESHLLASAPSFEEDDAGEILSERPVRGTPEAMVVNLLGVAVEQVAKGTGVLGRGAAPQLRVG
jgi:hypothetical protein